MAGNANTIRRVVIVIYLIVLHLGLGYFLVREVFKGVFEGSPSLTQAVGDPTEATLVPTPLPVPSTVVDLERQAESLYPPPQVRDSLDLIIPVAGVRKEQLIDSFTDTRSDERGHDAIDIAAPLGTPVLAATDGVIARFFDSAAGGVTIYQWTADRKYVLYYAHLQKRADDVKVGDQVVRGQTIGFVGDTGNAGPGNFHLHFSVSIVRDPDRFWEGDYLNPYPLLMKSAP